MFVLWIQFNKQSVSAQWSSVKCRCINQTVNRCVKHRDAGQTISIMRSSSLLFCAEISTDLKLQRLHSEIKISLKIDKAVSCTNISQSFQVVCKSYRSSCFTDCFSNQCLPIFHLTHRSERQTPQTVCLAALFRISYPESRATKSIPFLKCIF